jgi:hypothetical protein
VSNAADALRMPRDDDLARANAPERRSNPEILVEIGIAPGCLQARNARSRRRLCTVNPKGEALSRVRRGLPDPRRTVGRFLLRRVLSSIAAGDNSNASAAPGCLLRTFPGGDVTFTKTRPNRHQRISKSRL